MYKCSGTMPAKTCPLNQESQAPPQRPIRRAGLIMQVAHYKPPSDSSSGAKIVWILDYDQKVVLIGSHHDFVLFGPQSQKREIILHIMEQHQRRQQSTESRGRRSAHKFKSV
jgi:hypothetical protein